MPFPFRAKNILIPAFIFLISALSSAVFSKPLYNFDSALSDFQEEKFNLLDEKCAELSKGTEYERMTLHTIYWMMGCENMAYWYTGRSFTDKLEALEDWTERRPESPMAWTALGIASFFSGAKGLEASKSCIQKACELSPNDAYLRSIHFYFINRQGANEEAGDILFQKALSKDPNCYPLYLQKAYNLMNNSGFEGMKKFIDKTVEKAPTGSRLRLLTVDYHESMWKKTADISYLLNSHNWKPIQTAFETFLKAHPEDVYALSWYARLATVSSRDEIARAKLQKLRETDWKYGGWKNQEEFDKVWKKATARAKSINLKIKK